VKLCRVSEPVLILQLLRCKMHILIKNWVMLGWNRATVCTFQGIVTQCVAADHQRPDMWRSTERSSGAPASSYEKAQLLLIKQPV